MEAAFRGRAQGLGGAQAREQGARAVQRPPVYNSEDYTEYLRKYCKLTGLQVGVSASWGPASPPPGIMHRVPCHAGASDATPRSTRGRP
jgi:hypothetical protein